MSLDGLKLIGSLDARDDSEHNGTGIVEISKISTMQDALSLEQSHLTGFCNVKSRSFGGGFSSEHNGNTLADFRYRRNETKLQ